MLPTVRRLWPWCNSYCLWLCGFYYGTFHVESCLALCSRVSSVLFKALWPPRLGKRVLVYVLLVILFINLACVNLCVFFFSSSWCQGLATESKYGTPRTFHLLLWTSWSWYILSVNITFLLWHDKTKLTISSSFFTARPIRDCKLSPVKGVILQLSGNPYFCTK